MKVALDIQHMYKSSQPDDKGRFAYGIHEADIVKDYMHKTAFLMQQKGIDVIINDWDKKILIGDYWQRHQYANSHDAHLYIAGHLNVDSTQTDQLIIEYNLPASYPTVIFAHILGSNLNNYMNSEKVLIKAMKADDPEYYCLDKLLMPAVLIKPLSLYNSSHMELFKDQGLFVVAEAIRNAVEEYQKTDIGI